LGVTGLSGYIDEQTQLGNLELKFEDNHAINTGENVYSIIFKKQSIYIFQYSSHSGIRSPISSGKNLPKHHDCEVVLRKLMHTL